MKLIVAIILALATLMSIKAQNNSASRLIDPNTNTSWTLGIAKAIVWTYAPKENALKNSIERITPSQNSDLFNQQDAVPLSCVKYIWMVSSDITATDQASINIITNTLPCKTKSNFKKMARDTMASYADYFASATVSQPNQNINLASIASDKNNNLKYTAIFIVLFNFSIFLWI